MHTSIRGRLRHFEGVENRPRGWQWVKAGENLHMTVGVRVFVCASVAFGIFVLCKRVF